MLRQRVREAYLMDFISQNIHTHTRCVQLFSIRLGPHWPVHPYCLIVHYIVMKSESIVTLK